MINFFTKYVIRFFLINYLEAESNSKSTSHFTVFISNGKKHNLKIQNR